MEIWYFLVGMIGGVSGIIAGTCLVLLATIPRPRLRRPVLPRPPQITILAISNLNSGRALSSPPYQQIEG